ncbi:MAG: hypothetical protein ABSC46_01565 [Candidatus Limnocylindrales bacterium]
MSDEVPKAEEKLGLFFSPTMQGGGGFLVPMTPLKVAPGEPGPDDDWHMPDEADAAEADSKVSGPPPAAPLDKR